MPRRRHAKVPGVADLGEEVLSRLLVGHWYFGAVEVHDDEQLRGLWEAYGHQLLADWILEHPGTRPWAWWKYSAPAEPRRRIGGIGTPRRGSPFWFGKPGQFEGDYVVANPPTWEPEVEYLRRHGLLTPSEAGAGPGKT